VCVCYIVCFVISNLVVLLTRHDLPGHEAGRLKTHDSDKAILLLCQTKITKIALNSSIYFITKKGE
jgi:hypothetical protein